MILSLSPENAREKNQKRTASGNDLGKIQRTAPVTLQKLSSLQRRWASFFAEVLRMDYDSINCTIDELSRHEFRVNAQTFSERTTHRALDGLEKIGAIRRERFRIGDDRFRVKIHLDRQWFSWILKCREYAPTSYINAQLPKWQEAVWTDSDSSVPSTVIHKEQRSESNTKTGKKNRRNPILYTLMLVLAGQKDRNRLVNRAKTEIFGKMCASSGIDWAYFASNWQLFPIPHREKIALTQIVPALRIANEKPNNAEPLAKTPDEIIKEISSTMTIPKRPSLTVVSETHPFGAGDRGTDLSVDNHLSQEEMEILVSAQNRAAKKNFFSFSRNE